MVPRTSPLWVSSFFLFKGGDMEEIRKLFNDYAKTFDLKSKNIMYKYHHSYRVMEYATEIAKSLKLNEEELKHFIMIINHSEIIYPRIVYFRLADLFTKLNIDFDIIKWYENAYVKSHHLSDSKD